MRLLLETTSICPPGPVNDAQPGNQVVQAQRQCSKMGRLSDKPVEHRVKSWPNLFEAAASGIKTHDMRRSTDRDYRVGDVLVMEEFDPNTRAYTGRSLRLSITYVTSAENPCALSGEGLHPDYCILSVSRIVA